MCVSVYVRMSVCLPVCLSVCLSVCLYVCMYVCMYVYIIYRNIYTPVCINYRCTYNNRAPKIQALSDRGVVNQRLYITLHNTQTQTCKILQPYTLL